MKGLARICRCTRAGLQECLECGGVGYDLGFLCEEGLQYYDLLEKSNTKIIKLIYFDY